MLTKLKQNLLFYRYNQPHLGRLQYCAFLVQHFKLNKILSVSYFSATFCAPVIKSFAKYKQFECEVFKFKVSIVATR